MSGIGSPFCQRHGTVVITTGPRKDRGPCRRAIRFFVTGEGGATPAGRPAPQGAGARPPGFGGVAPPSPVTRLLTPDAAKRAASPSTSARHKVIVSQGLCGGASGALLLSDPRTSGPAVGPAVGPPAFAAAGPINTPPATIRT